MNKFWYALLISGLSASGCGNTSESETDDDKDESSTATTTVTGSVPDAISDLGLAGVLPGTLALSAFPTSSSSAGLLLVEEDEYVNKPPKEKVAENEKRLKGEVDSCFDPTQFSKDLHDDQITCYEFDSDMNPTKYQDQQGNTVEWGTTTGEHTNNEACLVAFARQEIQSSVQIIDRAMALFTGMICQAQKKEVSGFPAVGETLDLKSVFSEVTGAKMPITAAALKRLDDIDGAPVFRSDIEINTPDGLPMVLHLVHSPQDDGSSRGTLWFQKPPRQDGTKLTQAPNETSKNHVISIRYNDSLNVDNQRYINLELMSAEIEKGIVPFEEDGDLNFSVIPDSAENSTIQNIKYVAYDGVPETNTGNLAYWRNPGGRLNEAARGFLFNNTQQEDGTLSGCGVSGATADVSIRAFVKDAEQNKLEPVQFWHPLPGAQDATNTHPDKDERYVASQNDSRRGPYITEQCFKQNTAGLYVIDTEKVTSAKGYEVIQTSASQVKPPERPKNKIEGNFNPDAS